MKKLLILALLLVGCVGSNRDVFVAKNNERIWWRERNAPEWQYNPPAPIDSDDLTIIPVTSHTCPKVSVIKFTDD